MKKVLWLLVPLVIAAAALPVWRQLRPAPPVPVGVIAWAASGAVVGSSELNAADLYLEEHPRSRLRVLPLDDEWQVEKSKIVIQQALGEGVRLFVSTHPSRCAEASMHLFADGRALIINSAATSPVLTGKDDFLLRIIPDVGQEQGAIARYVKQLPGTRILVLQDTSNRPYTDPAFAAFSSELGAAGIWQIVHRPLLVSAFKPDEYRAVMAGPYDALYILAGTFQTAIGNIAQLFHVLHPAAPILLTPWARSPAILETAGDAIDRIILPSPYRSRRDDPALDDYFRRFRARFGYEAHAMTIGVRQALELLDDAVAKGYDTPTRVKDYLLSVPTHQTSLGPISFDRDGDVSGTFHFLTDLRQELK
ncbi:MAG TPA: ABC transporter substrate-binding protein [Lamprocystis sp. (in: g-proteobacteria)]|nr:ABC transporter substrate-binding protein [Lamprocystis sp. (in: g-proteobacteria)]